MITIVGLGPGDAADMTRAAWEALSQAGEVYLRTARHPTVAALPAHLALQSLDSLYEEGAGFSEVYDRIAERVLALGRRPGGVVYAVPGHPLVGETSVQRILAGAAAEGQEVRLIGGISFVEPALALLGLDGLANLQLADATEQAALEHPALDPDRPALLGQLYNRALASDLKLALMNAYPDEHPVTLVRAAGTPEASAVTLPLYELDRGAGLDHLTSLYVPPVEPVAGMPGLQQTVARLRAPGGCPWDREQTHQSLAHHLLEEVYEVLAALERDDAGALRDELGDLLMQVAMHVQVATESGEFRLADVVRQIDRKLKRRHPHVFGQVQVKDSAEVLRNWQAIKAAERAEGAGSEEGAGSSLEGIPATLPALARAQSLSERAAAAGFEWPDLDGVLDKVAEEAGELRRERDAEGRRRELGDLLFTLVNVARWLDLDAEGALRSTCDRFTRRYRDMERAAQAQGVALSALDPAEREALWEDAKAGE